jgi:hypothetical protein
MQAAVGIVLVSLGMLTGCFCEEWYTAQAAGLVTSAEGGSGVEGAEVRIRFDVGDTDPSSSCESLKKDSFDLVDVTDSSGAYKTPSRGFPHSCGSAARVNGSICVTAPGFQSQRFLFDADKSPDGRFSGTKPLNVVLSPASR